MLRGNVFVKDMYMDLLLAKISLEENITTQKERKNKPFWNVCKGNNSTAIC